MVEPTDNLKEISLEEIKQNDGKDGKPLWIIINSKIYDVSSFKHPGGREALTDDHGEDRHEEFESIHSKAAKEQTKNYLIGKLKEDPDEKNNKASKNGRLAKEKAGGINMILPISILIAAYLLIFRLNIFGFFDKPEDNKN